MRIKKDESYEKLVIAKIGASAGSSEVEIVGSGCLTKSGCKVKISVLVDLSACGGTFFYAYILLIEKESFDGG